MIGRGAAVTSVRHFVMTPSKAAFSRNVCGVTVALLFGAVSLVHAADSSNWAGEYVAKKFLNGQAVLQLSIEQQGKNIQVSFDAAYVDGHGAAPEGQGPAKATSKGTLEFKFEDSFSNAGTGTIRRDGDDVIVSIHPTRVVDSRCLAFYGDNLRLKRAGKK
jgi:hypothetical protein